MRLGSLFQEKSCVFALEVFPPKRHSGVASVYGMLDALGSLACDYISVTYSAGGSGATEYTAEIAGRLKNTLGIEPLAHLTCVNARREDVHRELQALKEQGVENILALRGDAQPGVRPVREYAHASDLIAEVGKNDDFYVVAACYPEGHPESTSLAQDVDWLKYKVQAGAGHLVSQLFFDNGKFYRFLNLARKRGLGCPVEAGVMPIVKPEQISRTVALSSASLPAAFSKWVSRWAHDAEGFYKAGIDYAVRQIRDLIEGGADGIHLYAMNNPDVAAQVHEGIKDLF